MPRILITLTQGELELLSAIAAEDSRTPGMELRWIL
jgi:hypothetical protein